MKKWSPRGEPLSGQGSSVAWTPNARAALLHTIVKHNIKHVVDAPCGDLTWMQTLFPVFEALGVRYTGVDIVRSQIASHSARFARPGWREFEVVDLATTPPPRGDLIYSRQALQHLNAYDALRVMHQWSALASDSGARPLLLTTTYEQPHGNPDENYRPKLPDADMVFLNFLRPPFDLPPPLETFIEQNRSDAGFYERLGLWRLPLTVRARGATCRVKSGAAARQGEARRKPSAASGRDSWLTHRPLRVVRTPSRGHTAP